MRKRGWVLVAVLLACAAGAVAWARLAAKPSPRQYAVRVVAAYPHDPSAFTEGLADAGNGRLYEGTGKYGVSSLRRVDVKTGRVEKQVTLDARYFGEGVTALGGRLYELTWRAGVGFVYDPASFDRLASFDFDGEGWGLTQDGSHLIMSDGTPTLRYLDPRSLKVTRRLTVRDEGRPVTRLNELEYVDGEIWANIWYQDRIARISPRDGRVLGWIDIANLYQSPQRGSEDVANGIAYDAASGRLYMTGKDWPQLFEVKVVPH